MNQAHIKSDIGVRIKALRKQFGLTAQELAEIIGISTEFVSLVERGIKSFSVKNLIKLSERFNTSLDYIILGKSLNRENVAFDTNILNSISSADYAFIMKLCQMLTYQKCTGSELDYLESLIRCYFAFKTGQEKSGNEPHQNEEYISYD